MWKSHHSHQRVIFPESKKAGRAKRIDLLSAHNNPYHKTTRTTRSLSFPTFTIPKGLFKNFPNGNVRSLICEYSFFAFSLTDSHKSTKRSDAFCYRGSIASFFHILFSSDHRCYCRLNFGPPWSKVHFNYNGHDIQTRHPVSTAVKSVWS